MQMMNGFLKIGHVLKLIFGDNSTCFVKKKISYRIIQEEGFILVILCLGSFWPHLWDLSSFFNPPRSPLWMLLKELSSLFHGATLEEEIQSSIMQTSQSWKKHFFKMELISTKSCQFLCGQTSPDTWKQRTL